MADLWFFSGLRRNKVVQKFLEDDEIKQRSHGLVTVTTD